MSKISIEHVAMYVNDLEKAKEFFEKYFNAKAGKKYHNRTTDLMSYFLSFDDGARLEIMTRSNMTNSNKSLIRTDTFTLRSALEVKKMLML